MVVGGEDGEVDAIMLCLRPLEDAGALLAGPSHKANSKSILMTCCCWCGLLLEGTVATQVNRSALNSVNPLGLVDTEKWRSHPS